MKPIERIAPDVGWLPISFVNVYFVGRPGEPWALIDSGLPGAADQIFEAAEARYGEIEVYKSAFRPMKATLSGSHERVLMKVIVDKASDKVVGVHIVGHDAGEMIQLVGIAVTMGATKADFDRTIAVHPTAAEELVTMRTPSVVKKPQAVG